MSTTRFLIKVDHFAGLVTRIEKGDYVDGEMLANAFRNKDTPLFPEIFLDYLCRFLENKIKRPRGRPKASYSKGRHRGKTGLRNMRYVTKLIRSGEYVSGSQLAGIIRREASGEIPDVLLEYLCEFLAGNIKKPCGRPPLPAIFKLQRNMVINGFYTRYTERLIRRKAREGHAAGWTDLPYPPAEIAARIVARLFYYGEESWRSVQNIASKQK